jgi:NitT/TauT family transport system substrate-binding protein
MRRSRFLTTIAGPAALATLAPTFPVLAETTVNVGVTSAISDAPFFIAQDRGFFRDQGLTIQSAPFATPDDIIGPLAAGQIDAAIGVPSATLYNAIGAGGTMRIVADMGSTTPGYGYNLLVVRKALHDSGRVKAIHDLRGLTIADAAAGTPSTSTLNEALKSDGLTLADIKNLKLSFAEMEAGLKAGTIDAALFPDPEVSDAIDKGYAVRLAAGDEFYANQELVVLLYSGSFITMPDPARKFMLAYLKGVRFFLDALHDGHFSNENAPAVIDILRKHTTVKNPQLYTVITPAGINPNGFVNAASLTKDLDLLRSQGLVTAKVTVKQSVDARFITAAARTLGRDS